MFCENRKVPQFMKKIMKLNLDYINLGLGTEELEIKYFEVKKLYVIAIRLLLFVFVCSYILYELSGVHALFSYIFGMRCIVPNNYFIWEATRPLSNCSFCVSVPAPIILFNATKSEFSLYAFTSKPVLIKQSFSQWPARHMFTLKYFEKLYSNINDAYKSVDEECQFLHFKSDFVSFRDILSMSNDRMENSLKERSWYIGWGNCHPLILQEMRKHYYKPHFLPSDSEIPSKDYIFMGYEEGATMHVHWIYSSVSVTAKNTDIFVGVNYTKF